MKEITYEEKKKNIKFATLLISLTIGFLAVYTLGYLGWLMRNQNIPIFEALSELSNRIGKFKVIYNPFYHNSLFYYFAGVLIGFFAYFVLSNDNIRNDSYIMKDIAGTGGFMDEKEMKEYKSKYIYNDPPAITKYPIPKEDWDTQKEKYSKNMIMSDNFCRPINSRLLIGNNNVLVVGGAGSGKSRFVIKPNMLQMNASYVVTDPSGEIIYSLGKVLRDNGYKIKIFNISDMKHSNCYNPIKYIRDEAGVNMVIQCLIDNTTKGEGGGDNQFFVDAEKLLYSACLFYLIDFCNDESKKNFAGVIDMINSSNVDEKNPNAKSSLDKLFDKLPKASLARKFYTSFKQAAGKTLKSIIISCVTRLQPFLTPQVANLTRTDDLFLEKIGDEKTALFIITPQADRTYSFLASMLYSQLFETLYHIGEKQKADGGSEELHVPVRCLMDEFANIGEVPEFPSKLSTMRKYNISATIVLQDIAQIESMYKDDWKTLVGNCATKVFLGSPEPDTLKWFSEQLGKMTVRSKSSSFSDGQKGGTNKSFQYTSREVLMPDELGRLNKEECIVYTQNMRPVRDKKYKYERHPYFKQTADYDENLGFEYNKLSVYDNTKMGHYMNLFVAQNEASRVSGLTLPKEAHTVEDNGDPNDIVLTEEQIEKIYQTYMIECSQKAYETFADPVCMVTIKPILPKYLYNLTKLTSDAFNIDRMMVFTPMNFKNYDKDTYLGLGISHSEKKELYDAIYKAKEKDLVLNIQEGIKYIMIVVAVDKYKEFQSYINSLFKNKNDSESEENTDGIESDNDESEDIYDDLEDNNGEEDEEDELN